MGCSIDNSQKMTPPASSFGFSQKLSDYWKLTKPEVNFLVVMSALAGFYLGASGPVHFKLLLNTLLGTLLVASGTATLNEYLERAHDARMRRTANALASLLAILTLLSYLALYTPLKRRTPFCTLVGAVPGAMPPLIGWAAASGSLSFGAWVLFLMLFLWQFPHFTAIVWMYRHDYSRAGYRMLPPADHKGRFMATQVVGFSLLLIPISIIPALTGRTGQVYLFGALILVILFVYYGVRLAISRSNSVARRVLLASIIYLPLVYALMMLDKLPVY